MDIFIGDGALTLYFLTDLAIILVLMKTLLWWNGRRSLTALGTEEADPEMRQTPSMSLAIAWGGDILALSILMTSLFTGQYSLELSQEAALVFSYGVLAILLLKVGERVHWLCLFSSHPQKPPQSLAMAMVQASHAISLAILFQPIMLKMDGLERSLIDTVGVFMMGQLLLLVIGLLRLFVYRQRHAGQDLRVALSNGHEGLGIRYFGHMVGSALAVSSAASISSYLDSAFFIALTVWALCSVLIALGLSALTALGKRLLLPNFNWTNEVDQQNNIAASIIEALIYISMALVLMSLIKAWL